MNQVVELHLVFESLVTYISRYVWSLCRLHDWNNMCKLQIIRTNQLLFKTFPVPASHMSAFEVKIVLEELPMSPCIQGQIGFRYRLGVIDPVTAVPGSV